jgi:gas vesicle protein
MDENKNWGAFIMGLGIGLLGGAIISLLLAPRSGKETRDMLADKISDIGGTVKEYTADREKVYKETCENPRTKPYSSEL